jgi:hypothetical protein
MGACDYEIIYNFYAEYVWALCRSVFIFCLFLIA